MEEDLAEGQRQISARNGAAAAASFERVLAARPDDQRATYGLAVASALQGKPDQARELFTQSDRRGGESAGRHGSASGSGQSFVVAYLSRKNVRCRRARGTWRSSEYRAALAVDRERRNRRGPPRSGEWRRGIRRRRAIRHDPGRQVSNFFTELLAVSQRAASGSGQHANPLGAYRISENYLVLRRFLS